MTTPPRFFEGAPCWAGLSTPDVAGARRFYGGLLGWTFDDPIRELAGYINIRRHGELIAGMTGPMPGVESPPAWGVWLKSTDVEASERAAVAAGGSVLYGPHDTAELGRMLLLTDPTGAVIGLWQPRAHAGSQLWDVPGAPCWAELYTRDGRAADEFYRALFDYTQHQSPADCGVDYSMYTVGEQPVAGRLQMTDAWPGVPPHWLIYFAVDDLAAALRRADELGGKVVYGPMDSPHGPNAFLKDPYGAIFAVIQRAADT
jgi:hypothetical protein